MNQPSMPFIRQNSAMTKVLGKDMRSSRCVVMPDPVIYAEKYPSHYELRQAAMGVVVDSWEVKHQMQVFLSAACHHQDVDSRAVKAFLKHYKIRSADIHGEKMSADPEAIQEFVSEKSNLTGDCASSAFWLATCGVGIIYI